MMATSSFLVIAYSSGSALVGPSSKFVPDFRLSKVNLEPLETRSRGGPRPRVLSHYQAPKVIRPEPSDGMSEVKSKARREWCSSTPSALSHCSAPKVINPDPSDGVSEVKLKAR